MNPAKVFISSTFVDMQQERDILSRLVFPRIRERLKHNDVAVHEVDLRWGVTRVMAANEGAADICLDEIEKCTPLVIGMVGNRIGWRPDTDGLHHRRSEFIETIPAQSGMTEIELLYAAYLARKNHAVAPAIMLRSLEFSQSLGHDLEEPEAAIQLRDRLPELGGQLHEYSDLREFEHVVEDCLNKALEAWCEKAADIRSDDPQLAIPRPAVLAKLEKAAGRKKPVFLNGAPGVGVSWLLKKWVASGKNGIYVDGRATAWTEIPTLITDGSRTIGLIGETGFEQGRDLAAELAATTGKVRIAIDHFEDAFPVPAFSDLAAFPGSLQRGVELVVAARESRLVAQAASLNWKQVSVPAIEADETAVFCQHYLERYSKTLTVGQATALATAPWASRIGAVVTVLDELRRFGSMEGLDHRVGVLCTCNDDQQLATQILDGLRSVMPADCSNAVDDALTAISLSVRGLEETEIRRVAAEAGKPLSPSLWSAIRISLGRALTQRGSRTDFATGPISEYALASANSEPERLRSIAASLVQCLDSERRRAEELPRLAFATGGSAELSTLFTDVEQVRQVLAVSESFADGWMAHIEAGDKEPMYVAWTKAASSSAGEDKLAWDLGCLASRAGDTQSAIKLLEIDRSITPERRGREILLTYLQPNADALNDLLAFCLDEAFVERSPQDLVTAALVVLSGVVDGHGAISDVERKTLLKQIRPVLKPFPATGSHAELLNAQIELGLARWRPAWRGFNIAESLARKIGHARLLCKALERGAAVGIERNAFRAARRKARECLELAAAAGLTVQEGLAFERLIEIERRRANWSEAYRTATEYLRNSDRLGRRKEAERMLNTLESHE